MGCLIPIPRSEVLVMVAVHVQVNKDQKVLLQVVDIYTCAFRSGLSAACEMQ